MNCAFLKSLRMPLVVVFAFTALPDSCSRPVRTPGSAERRPHVTNGFPIWSGFYSALTAAMAGTQRLRHRNKTAPKTAFFNPWSRFRTDYGRMAGLAAPAWL